MFEHIKPIDFAARRRRRLLIGSLAFCVMLAGYIYYEFKNYTEERTAIHFFEALQKQDFQEAYRLWQPTSVYKFKDFSEDWGLEGLLGRVNRFHVTGSSARGSGVVVRVQVNDKMNVGIWVEKKDQSLSFPP